MTAATPDEEVAYMCCEHCGRTSHASNDHEVPCSIPGANDCPGKRPAPAAGTDTEEGTA